MVFEKIRQIICEQLRIDEDDVSQDSAFVDDLGADSLDVVEMIMAFETEFDIEIPDDDVEEISTVSDAVNYIKEKKGIN